MLTVSNSISLLRGPLAFLFLLPSVNVRVFAVILAMISDCVDGYLARKFKNETFIGKILDPVMDKFFVYFVMGVLAFHQNLSALGLFALLARDLAVFLYVLTTLTSYGWKGMVFLPAYSSKITTGLQFMILIALSLEYSPPHILYYAFFALGPIIYLELLINTISYNKNKSTVLK